MTFQPAHKVTTSMNKPGQIVNPLMFPNQLKHEAEQSVKGKLTFEQWWGTMKYPNPPTYYSWGKLIWNAAQQNA